MDGGTFSKSGPAGSRPLIWWSFVQELALVFVDSLLASSAKYIPAFPAVWAPRLNPMTWVRPRMDRSLKINSISWTILATCSPTNLVLAAALVYLGALAPSLQSTSIMLHLLPYKKNKFQIFPDFNCSDFLWHWAFRRTMNTLILWTYRRKKKFPCQLTDPKAVAGFPRRRMRSLLVIFCYWLKMCFITYRNPWMITFKGNFQSKSRGQDEVQLVGLCLVDSKGLVGVKRKKCVLTSCVVSGILLKILPCSSKQSLPELSKHWTPLPVLPLATTS